MLEAHAIHLPTFGEGYSQRLKKEALVGRVADALSILTARIRRQDIQQPRRIGVFCQWGIGDAVLLLPLLRALRHRFPGASLELIGKPWLSELFAGEDCCDRTHVLVPPWTAYVRKYRQPLSAITGYVSQVRNLRREKFDWLISARFDPREVLQVRLLRASMTFGFRAAGGRFWITNDIALSRTQHDAVHRAELARIIAHTLTTALDDGHTSFLPAPLRQAAAQRWLADQGYKSGVVLAIHTGAGHPNRRWREPHFDTVLQGLNMSPGMVVFIEDRSNAFLPWNGPVPHVHWTGNLADLKALLSVCHVFLGNDSGVMHMASAAGCKVIAIFGSAESHWFGPANKSRSLIISEPMPCRPCFDKCIYSTPLCMEKISHQTVIAAVDRELA